MGERRAKLSTEELCPFDDQQRSGNGIKTKSKKRDKVNNTGKATKRKPSSKSAKKNSSTKTLKENANIETKSSSVQNLKENAKIKTKSTRATTGNDVTASKKTRQDGRRKEKEPNGSSSSTRNSNRSMESLSNSKVMDVINPAQVNDNKSNGSIVNARTSIGKIENDSSKVKDIIVAGNDRSSHRSSHSRILPERPVLEFARDKKRILEICYGSEKETPPTEQKNEESQKGLKDASPDKTLPIEEDSDHSSMHEEEKKIKKKDIKKSKKKNEILKEEKIAKDEGKEVTMTNHDNDPKIGVGPLRSAKDRIGAPPLKEEPQFQVELNATKSDDAPTKEGKLRALKQSITPNNIKKRRKRRPVVRRDAAGKIIRRRIKGKGRGRVVRKECIRKGKDANIGLATIDEGFYDILSDYSSDEDDWTGKSYESSNISGVDTDDYCDDDQLASFDRITVSSDIESSVDEKDGNDDLDTDLDNGDSDVNHNSGSARRIDQRRSGSAQRLEGEDIHGVYPKNKNNGIQRSENEAIEVSLLNGVSTTTTQHTFSLDDPNETIGRTPNNQDVATPNESGDAVGIIPDFDTNDDDDDDNNNEGRTPSLRSIPSVESTACTSMAEAENERDGKSMFCFGSYKSMICASVSFVVLVAAATVMVIYFITFRNGFDEISIVPPTDSPANQSSAGQRPSLRPTLRPFSTTEPSNLAPTLAPTTTLETLSTTCQVPEDKPDTAKAEIEYASELFGLASLSNANTGYCGEGYIAGLTRSGSGFGFRSFEVKTTGYYKVAIRYSHTDKTQQSLRLQIDDRNEGSLDLVSTGNETSWLIDSFDEIVIREGVHTLGIWVQSDGAIGPSADWMTLSLQRTMTTFEYLSALIAQSNGMVAQFTLTQTRTVDWMVNEDSIDWSTLTDREIIERYALVQIYHAAKGEEWMNNNQWLSEFHACSWYGITCSKDMLVTDLMLGKYMYKFCLLTFGKMKTTEFLNGLQIVKCLLICGPFDFILIALLIWLNALIQIIMG